MAAFGLGLGLAQANMNFNFIPVLPAIQPQHGASHVDLLWEQIQGQITRYNQMITMPAPDYQQMVAAPDGNLQLEILKAHYNARTTKIPYIHRISIWPGWIFMSPSGVIRDGDMVDTNPRGSSRAQINANPPTFVGDFDEFEDRLHGPFPHQGVYPEDEEYFNQHLDKIPRPRNPWIIYRQMKHQEFKKDPTETRSMADLSSHFSILWAAEPTSTKKRFKQLAAEEKEDHAAKYPNYVYQPRKPSEKKKRMSKKKAKADLEASRNGSEVLPMKDQERIHKNAVKFGIISADEPFVPRIRKSIQTAFAYEFDESLDMDSFFQEPFVGTNSEFAQAVASFEDGFFDSPFEY